MVGNKIDLKAKRRVTEEEGKSLGIYNINNFLIICF
jgi:hypothetical protein